MKCEVLHGKVTECDVCLETAESDHSELLQSLNKKLLRSLEDKVALPNPSVHLALRLSTHHNLDKENRHLNALKTRLHDDIQRYPCT